MRRASARKTSIMMAFVNVNDILLLLGEFGCVEGCTLDVNGIPGVDVADFLDRSRSVRSALFELTQCLFLGPEMPLAQCPLHTHFQPRR